MISNTGIRIVPGAVKTAGFKKMLLYQSLFARLMINASFSVFERHLLENNPMKLMRYAPGMVHTDTHDHKLQDLAPCTDSEFYVCSHSAPCWLCPNCSNILECIPVMNG